MARKPKSKTSIKVNFKGVESRRTPEEGDYPCKVLEATSEKSGAGNDQILFVCEISKGEYKGQKLYLYCPLQENSLWKLHAFLTALGVEVPEDDMDIDLSELIGEEFMGVLTHEVYNGRKRAKLTDFDSIENYSGKDDDDEPKKGKKSKKSKDDGEDEDDTPKKKGKKKSADDDDDEPKKGKKSKKSKDDGEDEDDTPKKKGKKKSADDDDDEPKKGKKSKDKGKKSKKKTYDRDEVEDMDEDELEELLKEAGLDDEVDLDDYKKLPKKVAAVIAALEEAELLDD
jgi:hypothetical protein